MKIYIPTFGRVGEQVTLGNLPRKLQEQATLVIDSREAGMYHGYATWVCPKNINTIGKVRQYIVERHNVERDGAAIVMLDDDLGFCTRRTDDPSKFVSATPKDIMAMFKELEKQLKKYAHAGVVAREGGNRFIFGDYEPNTRLLRMLGYNVAMLRKAQVKFDRLIVMEDFDVALQLLRKGYKSIALTAWCQGQGSSNAPGGCSTYRTMEKQREGALGLAKLHAPFVRVVTKKTKGAWNGQERTDVTVYWKKAYSSSFSARLLKAKEN